MLAYTQPQIAADALEVVSHPERFANKHSQRLLAWAILMSRRGLRVDQVRIQKMQRPQISAVAPEAV